MRLTPLVLTTLFVSCSAPMAGPPGEAGSIRIPPERPRRVQLDPGEPYPDLVVDRDPFVLADEEVPLPVPPPIPEDPGPKPRPPRKPPVDERCPTSCAVSGIIDGPVPLFVCGGQTYGIHDAFEQRWQVRDISLEKVTVQLADRDKLCALPFARAAAPLNGAP